MNKQIEDIQDIEIDKTKQPIDRLICFIKQIGDPYQFKVNDVAVRICFVNQDISIQQRVENVIRNRY